jgi:hypothetical protein
LPLTILSAVFYIGGSSEGQVYLALKEPVHVEVVPERFHFQQGDSVSLSCRATGIPTPSFVWKKDGHVLKEVYVIAEQFYSINAFLIRMQISV